MVQKNLIEYGVAYLNYDYQFKKSGKINFDVFPFYLDFYYSNLEHDPIKFDLSKSAFYLTSDPKDLKPIIFMALPII